MPNYFYFVSLFQISVFTMFARFFSNGSKASIPPLKTTFTNRMTVGAGCYWGTGQDRVGIYGYCWCTTNAYLFLLLPMIVSIV